MRYDHEWIHADPGESLRLVFENHCRRQQQGRDPVIIDRVDLSADHHTVHIRCRPHAEVMQMGLG